MPTKPEYADLKERLKAAGAFRVSNWAGAASVLVELTMFIGALFLIASVPPFSLPYWGLQLFLALSAFRCFVLMHECGHYTLFRGRRLNDLIGTCLSPFCLIPYLSWRDIHWQHHKWVGVIDKDPTQAHLLELENLSTFQVILFRFFWKSWLPVPFIRFIFQVFWGDGFRDFFKGDRSRGTKAILSVLAAAAPHALAFALLGPVTYLQLLLPGMVMFYAMFELVNLPQHSELFPFLSHSHPDPIPLAGQDVVTRTTPLPRFFAVLLTYNFNLHVEHHMFPSVPWYNLPKVQAVVQNNEDCVYQEGPLGRFMWEMRRRDPMEIYSNSLPKKEGGEARDDTA